MALFEAPIAHEAVHYSNPESHYSNPEFEYEYEDESHPYSNPELEYEGLLGNIISGIGGLFGGGEVGHEFEYEDEATEEEFEGLLGNILGGIGRLLGGGGIGQQFSGEYQADLLFQRISRAIKRVGPVVASIG